MDKDRNPRLTYEALLRDPVLLEKLMSNARRQRAQALRELFHRLVDFLRDIGRQRADTERRLGRRLAFWE
jgi:hypothetical protein